MKKLMIACLLMAPLAFTQGTKITAPKNSYSVADDVKVGNEAAAQVRKEMPILPEDGDIDSYVERVGTRLAEAIPAEFRHPEFRYEFSVVNAGDINAFALPGGPMFVNRGMIEAAHTEGEMAGVMSHELSHVALRHGTANATKAGSAKIQLGAIGGAILGAIIGGNVGDIVAQGTQLGLGTYLLKFSREFETQADVLGAQIMARAGYDPRDLASMFKTIEEQGGRSGPQWLSSHPNPGNRYQRINDEAKKLTIATPAPDTSGFAPAQAALKRMPPAPAPAQAQKTAGGNAPPSGDVEPPSSRFRNYQGRFFRISVPSNWQEFSGQDSVTFAPRGAFGNQRGQPVFTHGALAGITAVSRTELATANDQLISGLLRTNAYLKVESASRRTALDGFRAMVTVLSGKSDVTGRGEVVTVYTTLVDDRTLFHVAQVSPETEYRRYQPVFDAMIRSLRISK